MSSNIKIVVEGVADRKFLKDIASTLGVTLSENNFIKTEGFCSNWIDVNYPTILRARTEEMKVVLVLDADADFAKRKQDLDKQLEDNGLKDTPYFILPNNKDNGNLEDLLILCVNPEHQSILDCFDNFCNCVKGYNVPDIKTKVYTYSELLLSEKERKKAKEEHRDYCDANIWNLKNTQIQPLTKFLESHL